MFNRPSAPSVIDGLEERVTNLERRLAKADDFIKRLETIMTLMLLETEMEVITIPAVPPRTIPGKPESLALRRIK